MQDEIPLEIDITEHLPIPDQERAIELAKEIGVEGQHIAGAWPINLKFPSFALIGPRIVEELVSNLRNLDIELSEEQVAWLNLKN